MYSIFGGFSSHRFNSHVPSKVLDGAFRVTLLFAGTSVKLLCVH